MDKIMKLKNDFITHQFDDTQVMIGTENVEFKGVVTSNQTSAFIVDCLKEETTREQIIEKMLEKYDAPREIITEDVDKILGLLKGIGALDE